MLPKAMKQAMKFRAWTHLMLAGAACFVAVFMPPASWGLFVVLAIFIIANISLHFRYIKAIEIIDKGEGIDMPWEPPEWL